MPLRTAFLALLLSAAIHAEEAPSKEQGGIQVRLLAEQAPESLGKVFLQSGETRSPAFVLPTNFLSEPATVSARVMVVKRAEKETPLCTITLPAEGGAFAVLLVIAKPAGYSPVVVRTDDPGFKAGDVFFINRSQKTIVGKLGDTPVIIKPAETARSRPTNPKENTYHDIVFATRDEQGDKLISSSRWPLDGNLRSYVFFFTTPDGQTSFRAVDEYLVPAGTKP